jgi:lambda repressor-like predicted transcriptional regulator
MLTVNDRRRLESLTRRVNEARAKERALTEERLAVVHALWHGKGVSMTDLSDACGLHNWTLQRALIRRYGEDSEVKRERWGAQPIG